MTFQRHEEGGQLQYSTVLYRAPGIVFHMTTPLAWGSLSPKPRSRAGRQGEMTSFIVLRRSSGRDVLDAEG